MFHEAFSVLFLFTNARHLNYARMHDREMSAIFADRRMIISRHSLAIKQHCDFPIIVKYKQINRKFAIYSCRHVASRAYDKSGWIKTRMSQNVDIKRCMYLDLSVNSLRSSRIFLPALPCLHIRYVWSQTSIVMLASASKANTTSGKRGTWRQFSERAARIMRRIGFYRYGGGGGDGLETQLSASASLRDSHTISTSVFRWHCALSRAFFRHEICSFREIRKIFRWPCFIEWSMDKRKLSSKK